MPLLESVWAVVEIYTYNKVDSNLEIILVSAYSSSSDAKLCPAVRKVCLCGWAPLEWCTQVQFCTGPAL